MIELENPDCQQLLMRLPTGRTEMFEYHGAFYRPSREIVHTMESGGTTFTFIEDDISGLRLNKIGDWQNLEFDLWRLIVFDAEQTSTLGTSVIHPIAAKMTDLKVKKKSITATWEDLSVGSIDSVNVTLTIETDEKEDWINASVSVEWCGSATRFAVDSICCLPLRIKPKHRGSDFAAFPAVFGILSEDPVRLLRYDPSIGGTVAGFRGNYRNIAIYPSGRGWSMGVFGYYDTVTPGGWMVWNERFDLTPFSACFQSDGENMVFEPYVLQDNNIVAGNGGSTLEATDFCVRQLISTNEYGWYDIAWHYKKRLEELQPDFFQDIRTRRDDLSTFEKGPFLFIDLALSAYTGSTTYLDGLIDEMRAGLGLTTTTPIFGIGDLPVVNLITPYEAEFGDARATFATLLAKNIFVGQWQPASVAGLVHSNTGAGPGIWSKYEWFGNNKRWWTNLGMPGVMRMSRTGYLDGGGDDRLGQYKITPRYYRERGYTVTNWNSGTKVATLDSDPTLDGFGTETLQANVIPAAGGNMGDAAVNALAANQVQVTANFKNGQGATVTPQIGDTIFIFTAEIGTTAWWCPHAAANSDEMIANISNNVMNGKFTVGSVCTTYFDVFDEPLWVFPRERDISCYRDHSEWTSVNDDYVPHPLGGGQWHFASKNAYFNALRDSVRALQNSTLGFTAYMMNCEDVNETTNKFFDFCWHVVASGELWRSMAGIDPTIDKMKCIPFFAVAHSGRVFGRAVAQELSSAALITHAPFTDVNLHRTMAYWLASEWCYGLTLPTLSLYASDIDGTSALNFWDDTLYVSGGGSVSNEVKQIRQLYEQIIYAEVHWVLEYLRYGEMMAPVPINWNDTDWTVGKADTTYTTQYHSYDVIYDRAKYPNVVHCVWRSRMDGSVIVLLTNWTQSTVGWAGTLALGTFSIGRKASTFAASMVDHTGGQDDDTVLEFDPETGEARVQSIPPYSVKAIFLEPTPIDGGMKLIATWRRGVKRVGQIQESV